MFVVTLCIKNRAQKIANVDFFVLCVMQLGCMLGNVVMYDDKHAMQVNEYVMLLCLVDCLRLKTPNCCSTKINHIVHWYCER